MSMDLDELKSAWQALEQRVSADVKLNRELLTELKLRKARNAIGWLTCLPALELVLALLIASATGRFLFTHFFEAKFAIAGVVLHAAVVLYIAMTIRQIALLWGADMSGPVTAIQRALTAYGAARMRATKWVLILSPLLWGPLLIVVAKGWLGLDVYRLFGVVWVAVNVGIGIAMVPLLIWVSRRFRKALKALDDVKSFARE
jgi:hypothetical protein